jgi:transposase-like protein
MKKTTTRKRRSWTRDQKLGFLSQARREVEAGVSWERAARKLGVCPSSLFRWRASLEAGVNTEPAMNFKPVQVIDSVSPGLTMTTPDGFRVDGLDIDAAVLLVEMLR